jgi:hypothetical protein
MRFLVNIKTRKFDALMTTGALLENTFAIELE